MWPSTIMLGPPATSRLASTELGAPESTVGGVCSQTAPDWSRPRYVRFSKDVRSHLTGHLSYSTQVSSCTTSFSTIGPSSTGQKHCRCRRGPRDRVCAFSGFSEEESTDKSCNPDEVAVLVQENKNFLARLSETVERYLSDCGRRWVEFNGLFSYMNVM